MKENTRLTLREVHGLLKHILDILSGNQGVYWYMKIRELLPERKKKFFKPIDENQPELFVDNAEALIIPLFKILKSRKGIVFFDALKKVLRKENSPEEILEALEREIEFSGPILKDIYRKEGVVAASIE